ncbi:MAG: hypothetical protein ACLGH3_05290 [Actinomycetota bacterium]
MKRRDVLVGLLALSGLGAGVFAGGTATAVQASGYQEVALMEVPGATHLEFITREVDGQTRTFALVGSRDTTPPLEGVPATQQPIINAEPHGGLNVIDVTDPDNPQFVFNAFCPTGANDIGVVEVDHTIGGIDYDAFILLASNDTYSCQAQTGLGARGAVVVVGIRAQPEPGATMTADWLRSPFVTETGSPFKWTKSPAAHTVVVHPNQPVAYTANQAIGDRNPVVEILDLSVWPPVGKTHDLAKTGNGPHDITFSPDGNRAYVSSINLSFVWDTTGPKLKAPELVGVIDSPNLKIHHEVVLHPNGRHLLAVDEFVATSDAGTPVCPGGGVHILDLGPIGPDGKRMFETAPVPVGQFYTQNLSHPGIRISEDNEVTTELDIACTAHEFNIDPSGDWMPLAWMGNGVRELDLSPLNDPVVLDSPVPVPVNITESRYFLPEWTDAWAAKQHPNTPGYVFVSDTEVGFRVLKRLPL